jgi:hypothetical protein
VKTLTAALACLASALAFAGSSSATMFGVADDSGKYASDGGTAFFSRLADLGMSENRMAVTWDAARPTTIVDQAFLDRSVPRAPARGIQLVFAIYPARARALVDTPNGIQLFAQFAAEVARRYPQVTRIVCLNEGNQTRFQQPQYDGAGKGVAGAIQETAMAACYDALKAVNPAIDVIGFGFSPRGNDDPDAPSNVSHSPLSFLQEVGAAYRASGRSRPIADDVALHCYPRTNTDAPTVGFGWPNVGCANLDRFKQAWWDAFHGTGQPVFQEAGETAGAHVRLFIDEAGYQAAVSSAKLAFYSGRETVTTLDDATQGRYYAQLIAQAACDPDIALLNIFHLLDERSLTGWQSGLEFVDGSPRPSYGAVKAALAANRACPGAMHEWRHVVDVTGAKANFARLGRSFVVTAAEGFSYTVSVLRGTRVLSSAQGEQLNDQAVLFKLPRLQPGRYGLRVELRAATNPNRVTTFARTFRRG